MKTVQMFERFDYKPSRAFTVRFEAGLTYLRVIEAAIQQIERAGAGRVVLPAEHVDAGAAGPATVVDARNAFRRRR